MEAKCRKCEAFFASSIILVTEEGFYCQGCIPEGMPKRFITIHISWPGINALLDYIKGDASVDQLMIIEKITESIERKMMEFLRETIENGGEIQEPDSQSMGKGDD